MCWQLYSGAGDGVICLLWGDPAQAHYSPWWRQEPPEFLGEILQVKANFTFAVIGIFPAMLITILVEMLQKYSLCSLKCRIAECSWSLNGPVDPNPELVVRLWLSQVGHVSLHVAVVFPLADKYIPLFEDEMKNILTFKMLVKQEHLWPQEYGVENLTHQWERVLASSKSFFGFQEFRTTYTGSELGKDLVLDIQSKREIGKAYQAPINS